MERASEPVFSYLARPVNFAEPLLNHWNAKVFFPDAETYRQDSLWFARKFF